MKSLFKNPSAEPGELKNFRPISLLPFPDKVLQKAINIQLSKHLETNNLLDPSQSGFRVNHSTEKALIAATDNIKMLLDRGELAALILFDRSVAFDIVSHLTLINRLHHIRIQGEALEWIAS